jgi:hypothetical protein
MTIDPWDILEILINDEEDPDISPKTEKYFS